MATCDGKQPTSRTARAQRTVRPLCCRLQSPTKEVTKPHHCHHVQEGSTLNSTSLAALIAKALTSQRSMASGPTPLLRLQCERPKCKKAMGARSFLLLPEAPVFGD